MSKIIAYPIMFLVNALTPRMRWRLVPLHETSRGGTWIQPSVAPADVKLTSRVRLRWIERNAGG